mgnify:CR=1 FL=1
MVDFPRALPTQTLTWPQIEFIVYCLNLFITNRWEVCTFWEILSDETVGIFIGASLPEMMWKTEVDTYSDSFLEFCCAGKLRSTIKRYGFYYLTSQSLLYSYIDVDTRPWCSFAANKVAAHTVNLYYQAWPFGLTDDGISPQSPIRRRFVASFDLSISSWVIRIFPLRSMSCFVCRRLPRCLSLLRTDRTPESSQSSLPECMALYIVLQLTGAYESSKCSLPAICSGEKWRLQIRKTIRTRRLGSSSSVRFLQAWRRTSVFSEQSRPYSKDARLQ